MISIQTAPSPELEIRLARSRTELESAFTLLHDAYVANGFMKPDPSGMRVTIYHALPSTSTIIAVYRGRVVATVSVIRSNPLGLPLEAIFDTTLLKLGGSRIAEISSLAVHRDFRGRRGEILFPLLKFLYEYCVRFFGVDSMLIAVNPRDADFYDALLFFEPIEKKTVTNYDFVNGAPAVGRHLNLRVAYDRFAAAYCGKPPAKDLFTYFTKTVFPQLKFPDREHFRISDPIMSPELLDHFFNQRTQHFSRLPHRVLDTLATIYVREAYRAVLPPGWAERFTRLARQTRRYDVNFRAKIEIAREKGIAIPLSVKNVSADGFCAFLPSPIRFGAPLLVTMVIAEFELAMVTAIPRWTDNQGLYGFTVLTADDHWTAFVAKLEAQADALLLEGPKKVFK